MILSLNSHFTAGEETMLDSVSPQSTYGVLFEDDQTTGYFYALDRTDGLKILDALHIYNVDNVVDKEKPCSLKIYWSSDGHIAALLINDYCHAVFDFAAKAGYCRTGFPGANSEWCRVTERRLTDELASNLFNNDH